MLNTLIERLDRIEKKIDNKPSDRYLDIIEASAYTSLSVSTLRRYISRGELKCSRKLGKILFKASDIDRWLKNG
ncbi:MAG: helix-turn-helix domain-containing protein [Candidatus Marinimicrobia bacterium]|jgi:excisionase family DNA binding protein|nr:helix-turn-helix domain-containing protein [Candidatus Neomarinimicrobiota bacterium]MBT6112222.1 helix-turn-helix domain-containing protein [Candidatus Neomarinimicrobiota bacterium]MBT6470974.1 helix-turn-helix domain-containing protein [Candidatus Neomarinimicrobiota bacterium]MBT6936968.1 helix-turn-helix domain-containing protein [Candidatus Neomarinimicrobiota bacterium]